MSRISLSGVAIILIVVVVVLAVTIYYQPKSKQPAASCPDFTFNPNSTDTRFTGSDASKVGLGCSTCLNNVGGIFCYETSCNFSDEFCAKSFYPNMKRSAVVNCSPFDVSIKFNRTITSSETLYYYDSNGRLLDSYRAFSNTNNTFHVLGYYPPFTTIITEVTGAYDGLQYRSHTIVPKENRTVTFHSEIEAWFYLSQGLVSQSGFGYVRTLFCSTTLPGNLVHV